MTANKYYAIDLFWHDNHYTEIGEEVFLTDAQVKYIRASVATPAEYELILNPPAPVVEVAEVVEVVEVAPEPVKAKTARKADAADGVN